MDAHERLAAYLTQHIAETGRVVDYNASNDRLLQLDMTAANTELDAGIFEDTVRFSNWIDQKIKKHNCLYGIGGYMEHRTIYSRSAHFDADGEPRRLHLGVDIWGTEGTPVYAPLNGTIHSFQDNDHYGDYGPTILLEHNLDGLTLYSLYGHLSRRSLQGLSIGMPVTFNQQIATFGDKDENGHWPPHLHFQLMFDMEGNRGDYPGVCLYSEKQLYLKNIPDPQLILKFGKPVNV